MSIALVLLLLAASAPDRAATAPPRWALALSGGLARGIAHIGVLRAIEEEGIRPDVVVGTSMGGLIGALWVSGHSSADIQRRFEQIDVQTLFDPHPRGYAWRGSLVPGPWLTLFGAAGFARLPAGMLDDAYLNDLLVRHLIAADAIAQGDFDRLPIPWRAVASDLETFTTMVLDSGSVARAVRSSASVPVAFPAMVQGGRLVADGGIAGHLPMVAARADSIDHVLGIDVAEPLGRFDEHTSAVHIALGLFQQINRRGRLDARPGRDSVVWLPMPGVSPIDFRLVDRMVEIGYRDSREAIARLAREWRLARASAPETTVVLPPLREPRWLAPDGRPSRVARAARTSFRAPPPGRFDPDTLGPRLARVHRDDLFQAVWPRFRSDRDSTSLTFEVREHAPLELLGAAGFDRDLGGRGGLTLVARPVVGRWPAALVAGGVFRRFARSAYGSIEPRSLARGARGVFVRGGLRRTDTRLFEGSRDWLEARTDRAELLAGGQVRLPAGDVIQIGAGGGRVEGADGVRHGAMGVVRLEKPGRRARRLDAVAFGGERRYASLSGAVGVDLPLAWGTLRPGADAGWASADTPLDELPAAGGPATLLGLRHDAWRGQRALALELRFMRHLAGGVDADATVQAARVWRPVSRVDLGGRFRFAAGVGLRAIVPFGPLSLDLGLTEGGESRFDIAFGPEF